MRSIIKIMKSIGRTHMSHSLSEQKVLKKLGISDFRHMTKEKVVEFASLLHEMDPEVAKAAISQFPQYVQMTSEIVKTFQSTVDGIISSNQKNMQSFCDTCNSIISSMQEQLKKENLSETERNSLNDNMIKVAQMLSDKDSENKKHHETMLTIVGGVVGGICLAALAFFGKGSKTTKL